MRRLYNYNAFEECRELHPIERERKDELWRDELAQRMMLAILNLVPKNHGEAARRMRYEASDIMDAYNDEFDEYVDPISKTKTKQMLGVLVSANLIEKEPSPEKEWTFWCPNVDKLDKFLNWKYLARYPGATDFPNGNSSSGSSVSSVDERKRKEQNVGKLQAKKAHR